MGEDRGLLEALLEQRERGGRVGPKFKRLI